MDQTKPDLLFTIHDAARLMRIRFDQQARSWGMTRAQGVILMKLACRPGLSQAELAGILDVEPITVGRLIDRLEASGMVERRPDPADRRMHRLHLLPASKSVLVEIDAYRAAAVTKFKEGIPAADWDTAFRVLLQIKEKLVTEAVNVVPATTAGD
jgi:MarR family transcriptional regulator, transcriptional regulator for hemolysin